ncbi:flagellar hook-length control protein FliK [Aquicoccus sp. SU-CL01552]|uniref:flagellar hook-length control protein FliK n=1 Tax=Aquicoccus sp. SU-CL01552 TaxID=3127656 RepID=UPI0031057D75
MSTAINLASLLTGLRPEGTAASEKATEGFAALFGQANTDAALSLVGDDGTSGAKVRKDLYKNLLGLGEKAAQLDPEGDDPAETLEAVAELAADLATALAGYEDETGSDLVAKVQVGLTDEDLRVVTDDAGMTAALADPMAAVEALKSALSIVTSALRDISASGMARRTASGVGEAGRAFVRDIMAAAVLPDGLETPPVANSTTEPAIGDLAATVTPATGSASATTVETAPQAEAVQADLADLFPAFRSGSSGTTGDGGARALLARVVAVAADLSGASGPDVAAGAITGGGTGIEATAIARRLGPVEPLITPEDVARALAQGGQPVRDQATGAVASREASAEPSRFAAAVASQVRSAEIAEGRTRIELSPRGLGTIEVDVTTGSDGALKVVVRAENPAVLNALREERDLLAQVLGGLDTGSLDLQSFSDSNGQGQQGDQPAGAPMAAANDMTATGADPAPVHTSQIGNGRLDIVT